MYYELKNERLTVRILKSGTRYEGCRYDWSGIIEQVILDGKHTFCSEERVNGEYGGLGGIGLCSVVEWNDTHLHDETPIAGNFPILGVGLLKRNDMDHFYHTKSFDVFSPFKRIETVEPGKLTIRTLPSCCAGVAVEQVKIISLEDSGFVVEQHFKNVGEKKVDAHEFCHNFMQIDKKPVDRRYKVTFPYTPKLKVRRGEAIVGPDSYRPGHFDGPTASSAYYLAGFEGMSYHWMILSHDGSDAKVLIEDLFPVTNAYCWNNADAVCTETYANISLEPGEETSFRRKYTFTIDEVKKC